MSGISSALDIAKQAMAAQQLGLNISGHNIANVNTPNYSRQVAPQAANSPLLYQGLLVGTGVNVQQTHRIADQLLEDRLADQKSLLASSEQSLTYLSIMESLFSEDSGSNVNALMSEFWSAWHDLANNPRGGAERGGLYDQGDRISEQLVSLHNDLTNMETHLSREIDAATEEVNSIIGEIAAMNKEIVAVEATREATDQRDRRQTLVTELSQIVDVHTYEQQDGSLMVTVAGGYMLVHGVETYHLGTEDDRVTWQGSDSTIDITDGIQGGKIGGWLSTRDEVIAQYKSELDVFAEELIWNVNQQHSQGVGLNYFKEAITGTYRTGASGLLSTLSFGDRIDYENNFKMWIKNDGTSPAGYDAMEVDMGISTATIDIGSWSGTATEAPGDPAPPYQYRLTVTKGGVVDGTAATDGTDPQITWEKFDQTGFLLDRETVAVDAGTITIDGSLDFTVGTGTLVAGNTLTVNTEDNAAPGPVPNPLDISVAGYGGSIMDTYTFKVVSGGKIGTDTIEIAWENSISSGTFEVEGNASGFTPVYADLDGMRLQFSGGQVMEGDAFTLTTDAQGAPDVELPSDWHWTIDSFKDQFNRQAKGVVASVTADKRLTFSPSVDGREVTGISAGGSVGSGIDPADVTLRVSNYQDLKVSTPTPPGTQPVRVLWNGVDTWTVADDPGNGLQVLGSRSNSRHVELDLNNDTIADITIDLANAAANNGDFVSFEITADSGIYRYAFGDDGSEDSGLAAALGVNTFFQGDSAMNIAMNKTLANKDYIAAARISGAAPAPIEGGEIPALPVTISAAGGNNTIRFQEEDLPALTATIADTVCNTATDLEVLAANIEKALETQSAASGFGLDYEVTYDRAANRFLIGQGLTEDARPFTLLWDQSTATASLGFEAKEDAYTPPDVSEDGTFTQGDNTNALAMADRQFDRTAMRQWEFSRGESAVSRSVTVTMEDYYQVMLGDIGIKAASMQREQEFNQVMVNQLSEQRDIVSGVSLDEEMVNLIKYQHAFNAASKLIKVADEMLSSLINSK